MPIPDLMTVVKDPEFYSLPMGERQKVLQTVDPDFKALDENEQIKALTGLENKFMRKQSSPTNKMVPSHTTGIPEMDLQAAHTKMQSTANTVNPYANAFSPVIRTALEGGGAAGGTALGLAGGPVGGAVMGGAGYAFGKSLADLYDESVGIKRERTTFDKYLDPAGNFMEPGSTAEVLTRPTRDMIAGAAMAGPAELAAQAVVAIPQAAKGVLSWMKAPTLMSKAGAEKGAAEYLRASTSQGEIYARNADEAAAIEAIINKDVKSGEPLFKFSLGERSFDPNQIKAQQVINLPQGKAANLKVETKQSNDIALRNYFQRNFNGEEGADDFLSAIQGKKTSLDTAKQSAEDQVQGVASGIKTETPEQAGSGVLSNIYEAETPIKQAMGELEAAIPRYPMKLNNLKAKINEIISNPKLSLHQRKAIESFRDNELPEIVKSGEDTFSAMGINRTINDNAQKAYAAGDNAVGRIFTILKKEGLQPDIEAVSDLARSGKIVDFGGRAIDADALASELERNLKQLAEMRASSKVDVDALKKGIKDAGGMARMKVVREGDDQYIESLAKDYENLTGKKPPTISGARPEDVKTLETRNEWISKMLSESSPGQDVGARMRAFNEYSRTEYFGKFGTPSVEKTIAKGGQSAGTKMRIEQIPAQFKTATGAEDLINAIGPERAKEAMRGSFGYDILRGATDPVTGKIVGRKLENELAKNREMLSKYGLYDEFSNLQSAQKTVDNISTVATAFEKSTAGRLIGVDSDKAIRNILSGSRTAADMQEVVKTVKNNPAALKGLKNSFGQWVSDYSETTWKSLADNKATISQAQFSRAMKKANEAARVLYADEPQKLEALQTMQRAYEISARSSRAPGGVGSDSAEKVVNTIAKNAVDMAVVTSNTARSVKAFWNFIGKRRQSKVDEIIAQAIYDPDYAYVIMQGSKGRINPEDLETIVGNKIINLDDYRKGQRQAALTGTAAASNHGD